MSTTKNSTKKIPKNKHPIPYQNSRNHQSNNTQKDPQWGKIAN